MTVQADSRLRRSEQASYEVVAGEAILIHLRTGVYYSLNEVGTVFWNMLDGQRSVAGCAAEIAREYNAPVEMVQSDVLELAEKLVKEGLAETDKVNG